MKMFLSYVVMLAVAVGAFLGAAAVAFGIIGGVIALISLAVTLLWNHLVAGALDVPTISFWPTFGILSIICLIRGIIFSK